MTTKFKNILTYSLSVCVLAGIAFALVIQFKSSAQGFSSEEIGALLQSDSLCKLANTTFNPDAARIILGDSGQELAQKLNSAVGSAGLLVKNDGIKINCGEALTELRHLRSVDSTNGLYDFFIAYCLQETAAPESEVESALVAAFQAPKVDFLSDEVNLKMLEKSFSSASARFLYLKLIESAPQIQYSKMSKVVYSGLLAGNSELSRSAIAFALKFIPKNVKTDQFPDLYDWQRLRYSFAVRIINQAWPIAFPQKERPNYLIRRNAVMAETSKLSGPQQAFSKLIKSSENFFTCDREKFDAWFTEQKIQFTSREL